jgi:hypothetical protein
MDNVRKHLTRSDHHYHLTVDEVEEMMTWALEECLYDIEAPSATLSLVASAKL